MSTDGRHELKHAINIADMIQLRSRLPHVAKRDENAGNLPGYRVRSLYFDNYADKALREKIDGVNQREKFRIRLYNNDTQFIRLEKKSKNNGLCYKNSAPISKEECAQLIGGNPSILRDNGHPLMMELYAKMNYQLLRPKNIVDYMREAFVFPAGNVRITLDYDIRTSFDIYTFLREDIIATPIPNASVLEVKYDHFLPEIMRGLVSLSSRHSSAFSKYAITRII